MLVWTTIVIDNKEKIIRLSQGFNSSKHRGTYRIVIKQLCDLGIPRTLMYERLSMTTPTDKEQRKLTFSNLLMRTQSTAALSSRDMSEKWLEHCIVQFKVALTLLPIRSAENLIAEKRNPTSQAPSSE